VVEAVGLAGGFHPSRLIGRENDILIRGTGSPSGESQPADPSTRVFAGDIEVRQRFF
jgi:hypothetical protein